MTTIPEFPKTEREEVAVFASYCVGSCHGDWDPRVEAEYRLVMSDDAVFAWWRKEWRHYNAWHDMASA